jgi:hypothetical protein
MEILAEIIAGLVQFILEVLLQFAADLFAELGFEALQEVARPSRPPHQGLATFGYSLVGAAAGGLSLIWFPIRFAGSIGLRLATLGLAPAVSALMLWIGLTLLARPADPAARRRRFWYAYAFGLAFALIRFTYGK